MTIIIIQLMFVEKFLCNSEDPGLVYVPVGPLIGLVPKTQTQSPLENLNKTTTAAPFGK